MLINTILNNELVNTIYCNIWCVINRITCNVCFIHCEGWVIQKNIKKASVVG